MKRIWAFLISLLLLIAALSACAEEETAPLSVLYERTTLHDGYDPDRSISREELTLLLQAAFTMPTGGNQQSLEFFAVTNRETLALMRCGNPWSQALASAPLVIAIVANNSLTVYPELQEMDAGIAAGAILAQAAQLGLSTCVLSVSPQAERMVGVRKALGLSMQYTPILMVAVGHPAADSITSASVNNWNDTQVHLPEN